MTYLVMDRLSGSSVASLRHLKPHIQVDPNYQRIGDVWPLPRRQLLIDSILRNYDIPKIYFHAFVPGREIEGRLIRYAVIDGRQRLEALWGFLDDEYPLGSDAELPDRDTPSDVATMTFSNMQDRYPDLAKRLLAYEIDVVTVETDDEDVIDDMFLRLNEAAPLNAAEKRNAFGGPVPAVYKALCDRDFFQRRLPFPNGRYRHYDIATKFLYFEDREGVADTKKSYLDRFVRDAAVRQTRGELPIEQWRNGAGQVLDTFEAVFVDADPLLRAVGMSSVYYLVFRQALVEAWQPEITRAKLEDFERARAANRLAAREDESDADYDLLEFDRFTQSPNDAIALRFRRNVLLEFLGHPQPQPSGEDGIA